MMEELSVGSKQKKIKKRSRLTPPTMHKRSKLNEREVFKKGKCVTVQSIMATEELNGSMYRASCKTWNCWPCSFREIAASEFSSDLNYKRERFTNQGRKSTLPAIPCLLRAHCWIILLFGNYMTRTWKRTAATLII